VSGHGHSPGGEAAVPATWLGRTARWIEKAVRPVYKWLAYGAAVVVGLVVAAMVYSALGRYVKHPLDGSDDIMRMGFLLLIALGIGFEHLGHEKMTVDVLFKLLPKKMQAWISPIIFLLVLIMLGFAVYYLIEMAVGKIDPPERTGGTLALLKYPFVFIIAFGVTTLIPIYIARFLDSIDRLVKR
jgi:TRAP-type C4-dicarboxylate transport system permease small subunit